MSMDIKCLGTFDLYGGSFVLFIIAFSIPYWLMAYGGLANIGLWQLCSHGDPRSICYIIPYGNMFPDYWEATQAMETIGLLVAATGLFLCGIGTFARPENRTFRMLAGLAGVASVFDVLLAVLYVKVECRMEAFTTPDLPGGVMIGVIIFGAKKDDSFPKYDLHAGFGLAIVSAIGLAFTGILCFIIKSAGEVNGGRNYLMVCSAAEEVLDP